MAKLTGLPPEIRNSICDLLIIHDEPIPIASPRKKHVLKKQEHSNFACLLRVNKQINREAKTLFYARNTFIVGNGYWGSTTQANLQALKEFIKRVPKDCIALIHQIELDICLVYGFQPGTCYQIRKEEVSQLETISRALTKYFKGLESVSVTVILLTSYHKDRRESPNINMDGDISALARPIRNMLALPSLKELHFKFESARNIKVLVEAVLDGKEDAKDKVKIVKRDGSFAPLP